MGFFKMLRVLFGTAKAIRQSQSQTDELSALSMADFLPRWMKILSRSPDGSHPVLGKPIDALAIASHEQRLDCALPGELAEFYQIADGIDWTSVEYRKDFESISEIRFSSAHSPSLSSQLQTEWQEWGREQGEPRGLRVFSTSLIDLAADDAECTIPFSEVDDMLSLEAPENGKGAVLVTKENRHLPIGTVLEIENLVATRFESIRQWLGSTAASVTMLSAMMPASTSNGRSRP